MTQSPPLVEPQPAKPRRLHPVTVAAAIAGGGVLLVALWVVFGAG